MGVGTVQNTTRHDQDSIYFSKTVGKSYSNRIHACFLAAPFRPSRPCDPTTRALLELGRVLLSTFPVRVKKLSRDFQALIAREANRDWPAGTFGRSFPGLEQTLGDSSEIPFDQAEKILGNFAKLEARALRRLSLGGFELAGAPILPITLLVLVAAQIYFLLHFWYFLRHHGDEKLDFPWIALYPSSFAIFVFLLTCIAPACAALVVGHQVGDIGIWMIAFFNVVFSVVTCWVFLKWSWPRYKPLSASQ